MLAGLVHQRSHALERRCEVELKIERSPIGAASLTVIPVGLAKAAELEQRPGIRWERGQSVIGKSRGVLGIPGDLCQAALGPHRLEGAERIRVRGERERLGRLIPAALVHRQKSLGEQHVKATVGRAGLSRGQEFLGRSLARETSSGELARLGFGLATDLVCLVRRHRRCEGIEGLIRTAGRQKRAGVRDTDLDSPGLVFGSLGLTQNGFAKVLKSFLVVTIRTQELTKA